MWMCDYQRGGLAGVAEGGLDERAGGCGSSSVWAGHHDRKSSLALLDKGCGVGSELSQSWKTPLRTHMGKKTFSIMGFIQY